MWNVSSSEAKHERTVRYIRITISLLLSGVGLYILASQAVPIGQSYIKGAIIEKREELKVSPVPGSYKREIGGEFAYWDPGRSYFENLIAQAVLTPENGQRVYNPETQQYLDVEIDQNYSTPMSLTISSLDIVDLNITPNVDSYDENAYNRVLKYGLAHFKSTPLPGAGGNSFIYGHSAVDSYFNNHKNNPEVAFSILEDIKIGDEVELTKDGRIYRYVVRKKKIVEPTDFSILSRQTWKETLTLMTCSPVGIGTNRLVVTAELINGQ